ncbi:Type 1 glutamine amidotransferase-like domain-containing protein [Peribacillus frigoritolerans]|uniref:Type 1 glutamine amidotransferase-like domain-containing protein n=1 Tax=Peribacillus frigoritolerans TaxID=450367 RepID=UPI002E241D25|nr:Type 1 glutamine amidotransferase-like domain-containing protein [Peribacillus frigoritolerans]MED3998267.1 Type 1 glutamine amidotransferase-like domain-containing protein [Peribacillus frigoritolerans]
MEICFIGGGNHLNNELGEVFLELSKIIKPDARILIIPFATDNSRYESWMANIKQAFSIMKNVSVELLNEDLSEKEMKKSIKEHDILYFIGGRPERLIHVIEEKGLTPIIKDFQGLIIGYSAGSLAFCNDCIITKDKDYPETIVIKGLELVDFSVEVHYEDKIDGELIPLSNERTVYAIPNRSAIFSKNGELFKVVNDIYSFQNMNKEIVNTKSLIN